MEKKKAKRQLSNFSFKNAACHVSLVGPELGGPANGREVLVFKSAAEVAKVKESETMTVEMIEKSAHDALVLKAVEEAVAPVQKALQEATEQLEVFKAAQVAAVEKSRKDALAAVMGADSPDLEAEFAILKSLDESVFQLVLKSKAAAVDAISKSAMFQEVGVSGEAAVEDKPTESAEMRVLKQKYKAQ